MSITLASKIMERPYLAAIAAIAVVLLAQFTTQLIKNRRYFRKLQAQGMPMPPHSFLFGHLPVIIAMTNKLPKDAHALHLSTLVRQTYPEIGPDYYLDLWPFMPSMLVAGSPETLQQVTIKHVLGKNFLLRNFLEPLTDGLDLVSTNGAMWKQWRSMFNPGFSAAHLLTLTPVIVRECQIFCDKLDEHVKAQDIFSLKSLTDNLILDIIGQVTLDVHLHSQTSFNQIVHSLRTMIVWLTTGVDNNLMNRYNPARPFILWYHRRIVNNYVSKELDHRILAWQKNPSDFKRTRTIVDLALSAYAETQPNDKPPIMDAEFRKGCLSQIKIFLFAGHDTTSSSTCFAMWLLSQNPDALARLREEHNKLLGPDPSNAAQKLTESPHLQSQLVYTTAVIKEGLRLFPPITSTRQGEREITLVDAENRAFPTQDMIVWINQHCVQRDSAYWVRPEEFLPERWIVGPEDPLYPSAKGMWRGFEHGPRNCLGQELAMMEMRIVLVLMSRSYVVKPAYGELDALEGKGVLKFMGHEAYQVDIMQPRGNLPVRVERIKN